MGVGLAAGVITIVVVDEHHVHGPLGGLLAAGVTGVVIFLVSHVLERARRPKR